MRELGRWSSRFGRAVVEIFGSGRKDHPGLSPCRVPPPLRLAHGGPVQDGIFALDKSGKWVMAMLPDDAADLAGGTQPLLDALGSGGGNAGFIASSAMQEMYPANPGPLDLTGLPILLGLVHAASRAANPDDVRMERLEAISIPAQGERDRYHDAWVFFPVAPILRSKPRTLGSLTSSRASGIRRRCAPPGMAHPRRRTRPRRLKSSTKCGANNIVGLNVSRNRS